MLQHPIKSKLPKAIYKLLELENCCFFRSLFSNLRHEGGSTWAIGDPPIPSEDYTIFTLQVMVGHQWPTYSPFLMVLCLFPSFAHIQYNVASNSLFKTKCLTSWIFLLLKLA